MKRSLISRTVLTLALAAFLLPMLAQAQDLHPSRRPSPMAMARTDVGDAHVFVVYNRPYKRGRDNIFGTEESEALVPFGKLWRTGANENTQITATGDIKIGGKALAAGTYSLMTTPGESEWKIHINSTLGMSGNGIFADGSFTAVDTSKSDVLVLTVPVGSISEEEEVDQFTIALEATDSGADLVFSWITTEVRVPIEAGS
jgi:hypothetical protein